MYGHGIGRYSQEEIRYIDQEDLQALSTFLVTRLFYMGNNATTVDATVFDVLANLTYGMSKEARVYKLLKNDLKNLDDFVERMKNMYIGLIGMN